MKILKVEFMNINSLAGSWIIDFESPDFKNVGMFCISGPTGSGKTSILDAICLALYGRTPRQERVNKTSNEIMTRGTGSCQAKVTFENHGVYYTACWSQHRARDLGRGKLQAYSWLIKNEETGEAKSYADQSAIEEEISKLIGLDFEQFTKSMMLAQGRFNEFLKCKEKERAEILEKLTGDSLHRKIAKSVYALYIKSCRDVANIISKMDNTAPLGDDDRNMLEKNINAKIIARKTQEAENKRLTAVCQWYDTLRNIESEEMVAKQNLEEAEHKKKEFAPSKVRLENARRAQELEASYTELKTKRENCIRKKNELVKKSGELKIARDDFAKSEHDVELAQGVFNQYKINYEKAEPVWQQVTGLDEQIKGAKEQLDDSEKTVKEVKNEVEKMADNIAKLNIEINASTTEYDKIEKYIEENSKDEIIESKLSLLKSNISEWNKEIKESKRLSDAVSSADKKLQEFISSNEKKLENYNILKEYLESHSIDARLISELPKMDGFANDVKKHYDEMNRLLGEKKAFNRTIVSINDELKKHSGLLDKFKNQKETIVQNDIPVIVSELRKRLVEGVECPVCGSKEHPACSLGFEFTTSAEALNNFAEKLRVIDEKINNTHIKINELKLNKKTTEDAIITTTNKINVEKTSAESSLKLLNEILQPWEILVSFDEMRESLAVLVKRSEIFVDKNSHFLELETELNRSDFEHNSLLNAFKTAKSNHDKSIARAKSIFSELEKDFSDWFKNICEDKLDSFLHELENKNSIWKKKRAKQHELLTNLEANKSMCKVLREQLEEKKELLARYQNAFDGKKHRYDDLVNQRKELFGDKSVEKDRKSAAKARDDAEASLKKANEAKTTKSQFVIGLENSITDIGKAITDTEPELKQLSEKFFASLHEKGFIDENAFLAARLDEKMRKSFSDREKSINDSLIAAQTSMSDICKRLKAHNDKRDFKDAEDMAKQTLENGKVLFETLSNEYVELLRQQKNDDECRKNYAIFQKQLDILKAKQQRWEQMQSWFVADKRLDNGSGDAFVKFIQVITLRNLLSIANVHLREIWPRYELVTCNDSLEIQLIDHDNSDEIHPVTNISGGEGFLASLSLALAISTLASENVSIDSMFLDEGFGTLDNKILQETIVALQKLQQERGKMLGVITHVDLLKDELPIRIEVIPRGSGRSELKGAGVCQPV